jgi:prophage antirepressor-like protein
MLSKMIGPPNDNEQKGEKFLEYCHLSNTQRTNLRGVSKLNELTNVFQYGANELRTVIICEEPWFVAKDVCEVLELTDVSKAVNRLDEDEKGTTIIPTLGGNQNLLTVNESGLYSLILTSRKPEAKQFKRWITHEVLPSIRKTGQYVKPLTEREQLVAAMKLSIETSEEIAIVKEEVKEVRGMVENQITLDHGEQRRVQIGIASRIYEIENNKEYRPALFSELHREIRNRFGVTSYKDIKRKDLQSALHYIEAWVPRKVS